MYCEKVLPENGTPRETWGRKAGPKKVGPPEGKSGNDTDCPPGKIGGTKVGRVAEGTINENQTPVVYSLCLLGGSLGDCARKRFPK